MHTHTNLHSENKTACKQRRRNGIKAAEWQRVKKEKYEPQPEWQLHLRGRFVHATNLCRWNHADHKKQANSSSKHVRRFCFFFFLRSCFSFVIIALFGSNSPNAVIRTPSPCSCNEWAKKEDKDWSKRNACWYLSVKDNDARIHLPSYRTTYNDESIFVSFFPLMLLMLWWRRRQQHRSCHTFRMPKIPIFCDC